MIDIEMMSAFLGWCTVINMGLYAFSAVALLLLPTPIKAIHSKVSRIPGDQLDILYFKFLANYKLAIILFNAVPYVALKLMI